MSAEPLLKERFNKLNFKHTIILPKSMDIYAEKKPSVISSFAEDVENGLTSSPKYLLPKYFYDDKGSQLFEKITKTKEYYPTKTEWQILNKYAKEIRRMCGDIGVISELGSGSSEKTQIILNVFAENSMPLHYIPIDVSDILIESGKNLINNYPNLSVTGIVSGYEEGLSLLADLQKKSKLILFFGSSIGNFEPDDIMTLMQDISNAMDPDDYLLIGFDLEKDESVLNRAYNDRAGITEAFNKNMLKRINRELDADFQTDHFGHQAFYNREKHRVEMHLVSLTHQFVHIGKIGRTIPFRQGETIHTENSHKFSDTMINEYVKQANLRVVKTWKDEKEYFALTLIAIK